MDKEPTLFVGLDSASKEHEVCLIGAGELQQRAFAHDADGPSAMVAWLLDQAPASEIAVAIETPHGPVVEALMHRRVAVFAINSAIASRRLAPRMTAATLWCWRLR